MPRGSKKCEEHFDMIRGKRVHDLSEFYAIFNIGTYFTLFVLFAVSWDSWYEGNGAEGLLLFGIPALALAIAGYLLISVRKNTITSSSCKLWRKTCIALLVLSILYLIAIAFIYFGIFY